jgi:dTDP-glucose 4,6-dehydratase
VLLAIPRAEPVAVRSVIRSLERFKIPIKTLPNLRDVIDGKTELSEIRNLSVEDLLARAPVGLDQAPLKFLIGGRRVLVTGAGGSIGSELCRQIHALAPAQLVMLDRDETGLQHVQLSIEGQGLLDRDELVVADIRDQKRMAEVFARFRPQVVFHAAALKHLTLLERNPDEGWKTNVIGTHNVLTVAGEHDVEVFVNISTDKAADPSSVLGRTKRAAERLTAHAASVNRGTYLSVRFGNVLGSRGSMLPLFRAQIAAGGPVTVTHPDVSRYFMTIPEACELGVQAGALGDNGQVMVLNMGTPVRIADVARRLINEANTDVEIVYTGLRQGEKLHEVLFGDDEHPRASDHPLISCVDAEPATPEALGLVPNRVGQVIDLRATSDRSIAAS